MDNPPQDRKQLYIALGAVALAVVGGVVAYFYLSQDELAPKKKKAAADHFQLKGVGIQVAESEDEIDIKLQALLDSLDNQTLKVVGLDTEWPPSTGPQSPLALLQLSTDTECLLVRLCKIQNITPKLKTLLEDIKVLKAGVAIATDAKLIFNQFGVMTQGCVDVSAIAHREDKIEGSGGLAGLALSALEITMNKLHYIRCGDWASDKLTEDQIHYGATDAWVGQKLLVKFYLDSKVEEDISTWCGGIIDSVYHSAFLRKKGISIKPEAGQEEEPRYEKLPFRKTDLYENVIMQGPDGLVLCSINYKKANWYLQRDLAEWFSEDPENPILRLKIQPGGKGHAGDEYYMAKKENKCVVCGQAEKNCRFSIVPHSFRKYFPLHLKSHASHDIVLLCQRCLHQVSNHAENFRRKLIFEETGLTNPYPSYEVSEDVKDIVKIASGIKAHSDRIPANRLAEMKEQLKAYLKHPEDYELTEQDIEDASKLTFKTKLEVSTPEETIVKKLTTTADFQKFIERFRANFIETANPKHMPIGWRLDHSVIVQSNKFNPPEGDLL